MTNPINKSYVSRRQFLKKCGFYSDYYGVEWSRMGRLEGKIEAIDAVQSAGAP